MTVGRLAPDGWVLRLIHYPLVGGLLCLAHWPLVGGLLRLVHYPLVGGLLRLIQAVSHCNKCTRQ